MNLYLYRQSSGSQSHQGIIVNRKTLLFACQARKVCIFNPLDLNKECTIIPGLLVKELGPNDSIAYGVQDGPNIAPLSINQLLACQANGFKYDKNNTVGSAKFTTSPLGVN